MKIQIKRVYEEPNDEDGIRILVDRLWPRGLSKENAKIDKWMKEIAPSTELRKWYNHEAEKWEEFKKRYFKELDANRELVMSLCDEINKEKVTFLFASKEAKRNNVFALKEYMEQK